MSIPAPTIAYPMTSWTAAGNYTYDTSDTVQLISGTIPVAASSLERNTLLTVQYRYKIDTSQISGSWSSFSSTGITAGTTNLEAVSIPWSLNTEGVVTLEEGDTITFEFKTVKIRNYYNEVGPVLGESSTSPLVVNIVSENQITATATPVTGFKLKRSVELIKLFVPQSGIAINANSEFSGCNFYLSLTAGGGATDYVKMNEVLVTDVDTQETEEQVLEVSSFTDTTNNLEISTTKTRQISNEYYTFDFNDSVISQLIVAQKIPNIYLSDGQTLRSDLTYYFVATVTAFDTSLNEAVESPYSQELEAEFLKYSTEYQSLPTRSRSDILFAMSREMMNNNSRVKVVPGSVIRDISDPVALEFEKAYVIQNFVFATLSVDTLIQFDDSDRDGISDPLELNPNKRALASALGIQDAVSLQLLIDEQFEKQAANYDLERMGASRATGSVVFYTEVRPADDVLIPDGTVVTTTSDPDRGIASASFQVRGSQIMSLDNIDYYYNPTLKRYEIEASIEAQTAGANGNVPAGSISISPSVSPVVSVINNVPTRYGSDRETNSSLANRIKIARSSFDSGTEGGYSAVSYEVAGVVQARVEQAQDPLMMRDYDETQNKHIGGKVDVYLKGRRDVQLTDQVAFAYEYPTDSLGDKVGEVFSVVNAAEYRLRCQNPKVTSESPIVSVTSVRNVTRGEDYSIDGLQIIGEGGTVVLASNLRNKAVGMATLDVIEVNYLYRSANTLVLSQQPVDRVVSVTTSGGQTIDSSKYALVKTQDPLQEGESSIAKSGVRFFFEENDDIQEIIQVNDEQHDMLLNTPARLDFKGVTQGTIVVTNTAGTQTYKKDIDYGIESGSETEYTYLTLLSNSAIRHGDRVSVDYQTSENFDVRFVSNDIVRQVQDKIDNMKHACADAITKQATENFVDISFRVVRKAGEDKNILKSRIQTAVANYVVRLRMGEVFTQGALVSVVQGVEGVKELQLPLTRMMKRTGSFIPLDDLGRLNFEIYQRTSGNGVTSYRTLSSVLTYNTSDNGGDPNLFRGVYEDNKTLDLVSSAGKVSRGTGRAYIQEDGKLVVSTSDGAPPQTKYYKASYYTYYAADENIVGDIETSTTEYLSVDSISMKDIEILDERVTRRGL